MLVRPGHGGTDARRVCLGHQRLLLETHLLSLLHRCNRRCSGAVWRNWPGLVAGEPTHGVHEPGDLLLLFGTPPALPDGPAVLGVLHLVLVVPDAAHRVQLGVGQNPRADGVQEDRTQHGHAHDVEPGGHGDEHLHVRPGGVAVEKPLRDGHLAQSTLERGPWECGEETKKCVRDCGLFVGLETSGTRTRPAAERAHGDEEDPEEAHAEAHDQDREDARYLGEDADVRPAPQHAEEDELAEDPNPAHDALHLPEDAPV
mmetsp:Transcript_55353/g.172100  ORF Transcript_55353/g.172100 Transcript_55353/m.172100 type:complete len:258 (+) Transcript_55353:318-1091(+)